MNLFDYLKSIDYEKDGFILYEGERELVNTLKYHSDKYFPISVTNDIEDFITVHQGEYMTSFRPETITSVYKSKHHKLK